MTNEEKIRRLVNKLLKEAKKLQEDGYMTFQELKIVKIALETIAVSEYVKRKELETPIFPKSKQNSNQ